MAAREKSALYPAVTWQDCIDFIRKVDSFKIKTVGYQVVAELYGLSSVTTKSFTQRVGTSKQFGLISTSNSTISLTELAQRILYPTHENIRETELQCFKMPPLYSALIEQFNGKQLPSIQLLSNILFSQYKITKSAKDQAAKVFIENCDQLGLIKAGVFCYDESAQVPSTKMTTDVVEEQDLEYGSDDKNAVASVSVQGNESDYIVQTYPVESGKVAKLIIPIDSTEDDLFAVRDLLEVIMKRKFKMDI